MIPDLVQGLRERLSFKKPSRTILKAGSHIRDLQLPGFILFDCPITNIGTQELMAGNFLHCHVEVGPNWQIHGSITCSTNLLRFRIPKPSAIFPTGNMNHHIPCIYSIQYAYIEYLVCTHMPIPLSGSETTKMFVGFGSFNISCTRKPHTSEIKVPIT